MNYEKIIKDLSDKRYTLIDSLLEDDWESEIDVLGDEILNRIKEYKDSLSFEFIFEELTKLGQAPNLLYDDNGYFAIEAEGYQTVVTEPTDVEMHFMVEKEKWCSTIREALNKYFEDEELNN